MAIPVISPFRPYERVMLEPRVSISVGHQDLSLSQRVSAFVYELFAMIRSAISYICPCVTEHEIKSTRIRHSYGVSHHLKVQAQIPKCGLTVDGGGVRGVIALTVLTMLEKEVGAKISEMFDLLAGTSTGGIVIGGLTVPDPKDPTKVRYSAEDVLGLYCMFAEKVFSCPLYQKLNPLWGAFSPKYASPRAIFESFIEDCEVSDLLAKRVIFTAYALSKKLMLIQNTPTGAQGAIERLKTKDVTVVQANSNTKVVNTLLATSAAPTYFDSVILEGENTVDGGVVVNNPAEIAVLELQEMDNKEDPVFLFSVGTGSAPSEPVSNTKPISKGWIWWAEPLIGLLIDASSQLVCAVLETMAKTNPKINYIRFQVELPNSEMSELDNASPENLQRLQDLARQAFQHYLDTGGREALVDVLKNRMAKIRQLQSSR
jgi:patatin-like phospholipase/acyl hydrolase